MTDIFSITKLYSIFSQKKWHANEGNDIIYSNFCALLANLSELERKLILELTNRYIWITYKEYQSYLIQILNGIEDEKIKSIKRIYLFPIMRKDDESDTKSGHSVLYLFKSITPILLNYKHITFKFIETFEEIQHEDFEVKEDEIIFLIDDFLGSGDTIQNTLENLFKNKSISIKNLNVISIATQKEAFEAIVDLGISFYTHIVMSKGISDYFEGEELDSRMEVMKSIEELIPKTKFNFGYKKSEALITMMRTPNNTFPIFWQQHKKGSTTFDAPFSRY